MNQCWNIANRTLGNKLQWNRNRNLHIYIQENALENVVWKMAAILSRPQWIKSEFSPKYLQHTPHSSREAVEYLENHDIFPITGPLLRESIAERWIQDLCCVSSRLDIYIDGSVQDCSISSVLAMDILQSCTEPSTCNHIVYNSMLWWYLTIWHFISCIIQNETAETWKINFHKMQIKNNF